MRNIQSYPDSQEHFNRYLAENIGLYVAKLQELEMEPNAIVMEALTEKILREALSDYTRECITVRDANVGAILAEHKRRDNEIKRSGIRLRWLVCPPMMIGGTAGTIFAWTHGAHMTAIFFGVYAFAFLAMLIGGLIWDRPTKEV